MAIRSQSSQSKWGQQITLQCWANNLIVKTCKSKNKLGAVVFCSIELSVWTTLFSTYSMWDERLIWDEFKSLSRMHWGVCLQKMCFKAICESTLLLFFQTTNHQGRRSHDDLTFSSPGYNPSCSCHSVSSQPQSLWAAGTPSLNLTEIISIR